jgi:predicted nucleic acid-binding protein
MRTAIDTNVLSALWSREPLAGEAAARLGRAHQEGGLVIAAPVYAELLAHPSATESFVDTFLDSTHVVVDFALDDAVWREAGRCFRDYAVRRRTSGSQHPKRLLFDFVIGAHAGLCADRLLTLDRDRYKTDFPQLVLI